MVKKHSSVALVLSGFLMFGGASAVSATEAEKSCVSNMISSEVSAVTAKWTSNGGPRHNVGISVSCNPGGKSASWTKTSYTDKNGARKPWGFDGGRSIVTSKYIRACGNPCD